jgi:hypothetical protein
MPKVPKSRAQSIAELLSKTNYYNGTMRRDGDVVFCRVCSTRLMSARKSSLDAHVDTDNHKKMLKRDKMLQKQLDGDGYVLNGTEKEPVEALTQSSFMSELTQMMISCDIPLNKLNSRCYRNFFEKYTKFNPPSEPMARQFILPKIYEESFVSTKCELARKKLWISIDETRDRMGRFVGAIVIRSLDQLDKPHLLKIIDLEATNFDAICRAVDDAVKSLGDTTKREDFLMFLTDDAKYMIKAGNSFS